MLLLLEAAANLIEGQLELRREVEAEYLRVA